MEYTLISSRYFNIFLLPQWVQELSTFNPIPAGGGVNLTPPVVFFYITQKVLV